MKDMPAPQPLFHRSFGHGARKLLALHCTIAHSGAWRGVATALDNAVTMVAPDMLSHGRSPDWDRQGDFHDRITEAVLPLLSEPMDVIGHSFGATVALRLAIEHPGLVRSLTMVEPVLFAVALQDDPQAVERHIAAAAPVWEALDSGDAELAARLFNRMWGGGGPRWPDLPDATRAAMTRGIHVVPACDAALFQDSAGLLNPDRLGKLSMPVQLLRGSASDPIIATINEGLARRIPGAESHVVDGAGHMLPISHPAETAAHLRTLFARTPA